VSPLLRWLAACIWAASIAGATLTAPDNRWFYGAFAGAVVGVAFALTWRWSTNFRTRRGSGAAAIAALAGGIALFAANLSIEPVCTARNAAGQRVVIGTEFTEDGKRYHAANPSDDKNAILESLGGLGPQQAWTQASIDRCHLMLVLTGATWIPLFGIALTCALGLAAPSPSDAGGAPARSGRKKVFISYNHEDAEVAVALRDVLSRNGVEVIIDVNSMTVGQRIEEFIMQSIRAADAVVSIVSTSSLLSSWVAMETIKSLHGQEGVNGKIFIGCYLSDDYFRPEFRLECTRQIDERLQLIDRLIAEYAEKKLDPVDLNEEKTRLFDLRNHLGAILAQLKQTLCLDLRGPEFESSVESLLAAIKGG
jgi:hypothetical protein